MAGFQAQLDSGRERSFAERVADSFEHPESQRPVSRVFKRGDLTPKSAFAAISVDGWSLAARQGTHEWYGAKRGSGAA